MSKLSSLRRKSFAAPSSILDYPDAVPISPRSTSLSPIVTTKPAPAVFPRDIYKVIIVDDSKAYVARLKKVLERTITSFEGKTLVVFTVSDPADALQLMTKQRFSLCLVDNIYTGSSLSGMEVCDRMNLVEQETQTTYAPRILISGEPPGKNDATTTAITTISTTSPSHMNNTNPLLRIEKNEVGVGLFCDLLRKYGQCLTLMESNDFHMPLLSGSTRLRLTSGYSTANALMKGAVLFWGQNKQNVNSEQLKKSGLSEDFVDFLALPPVKIRNKTAQQHNIEGGAALINGSQWNSENTNKKKNHNKLTYTIRDKRRRASAAIFISKPKTSKVNVMGKKQEFWKQLRQSVRKEQKGDKKQQHQRRGSAAFQEQIQRDTETFRRASIALLTSSDFGSIVSK